MIPCHASHTMEYSNFLCFEGERRKKIRHKAMSQASPFVLSYVGRLGGQAGSFAQTLIDEDVEIRRQSEEDARGTNR